MMPSRLVAVRRFPNLRLDGRGHTVVGIEEQQLLSNASIESYVKLDRGFSVALMVPEAQAEAARRVLADIPDLFKHHLAPPCPRCHTFQPELRRPYELVPIAVSLFIATGVAVAGLSLAVAYGAAAASVVVAAVMNSHMPPWRCHACGFRYGSPHDRRTLDG
jgi:hypothetical protein